MKNIFILTVIILINTTAFASDSVESKQYRAEALIGHANTEELGIGTGIRLGYLWREWIYTGVTGLFQFGGKTTSSTVYKENGIQTEYRSTDDTQSIVLGIEVGPEFKKLVSRFSVRPYLGVGTARFYGESNLRTIVYTGNYSSDIDVPQTSTFEGNFLIYWPGLHTEFELFDQWALGIDIRHYLYPVHKSTEAFAWYVGISRSF